jgi:hypothetical protein
MKSPFADTPASPVIPEFAFVLHMTALDFFYGKLLFENYHWRSINQ